MIGRWWNNMVGNMWERAITRFFEDPRLSVTFVDSTKKQPASPYYTPPPQQPVEWRETPPSSSNIALGVCSLMGLGLALAIVVVKIIHFGDDEPKKPPSSFKFRYAALIKEFERSGCQPIKSPNLAEKFRLQGNTAVQLKLYSDAIKLYSYAIKLSERNSVCYCNRAIVFYKINKYVEAIRDCKKSIEIDPNCSRPYAYLGYAYFAQGKYRDAIDKGLMKALQLDPDSARLAEYLQVAEERLGDVHRTNQNQVVVAVDGELAHVTK